MRAIVQRVSKASVSVDDEVVASIGAGLVILLGVKADDSVDDARYLAEKCINLRIFSDEQGKFNLSALDVKGDILVISQFTVYGDTRKGRRPSFIEAATPDISEPLYDQFIEFVADSGLAVRSGRFAAHMLVEIYNDGPVTLIVESK
ncbi:D-tyrosyl-tRNA(Tyr) deacylase [candidate division KSB1 bacterium]|nr:D-tyrosyl-tRNA(Tyr) deacylase [candidate division KSB1 bacterium]